MPRAATTDSTARLALDLGERVRSALAAGVVNAVVPGRHERPLGTERADGRRTRRRVLAVLAGLYALVLVLAPVLLSDDRVAVVPAVLAAAALVAAVWRPLDAWRLATAALVVLVGVMDQGVESQTLEVLVPAWVPLLLLAALAAPGPTLLGVWVVSAVALGVMGLLDWSVADPDVSVPLLFLPLLVGTAVRVRRDALERVAAAGELTEVERDARIAMAERARIAREMHDLVAHHLSAVAVRAETAPYRRPGLPDAALEELQLLAVSAREAMRDMQQLLGVLRSEHAPPGAAASPAPPVEEPGGVAPWHPQPGEDDLLPLLVAARTAGTDVTWQVDFDRRLPPPVALTLYRALAQGLANARQHAAGARVRVTLGSPAAPPPTPEDHGRADVAPRPGVRLTVTSATGLDHGPGSGLGLASLHERVGVHAGLLVAGPSPEGGFVLDVWVPWAPTDGDRSDVAATGPPRPSSTGTAARGGQR
ncbi:sensor histidine kinase [Pseudokineococcus sp. 1T1Z-3]|uniref:sensor histidine kinase n=1 Tax=Pseudokineococcus sp. 1T1Z-3 TaxID=3132745 RepID=UPI0030A4988E